MAKNPNPRLDQQHTLYCAGSGGGKNTAIHHLNLILPHSGVVVFDPYGLFTHVGGRKAQVCRDFTSFYRKLALYQKRKRPFVLTLHREGATTQDFDAFCKMVWDVADGNQRLEIVCDEMIRYLPSASMANEGLKEIIQGGRQFGLVFHGLFQRAQEVPKTIVRGCARKWIGKPDSTADAKYWAQEIDTPYEQIAKLAPLEYFLKQGGVDSTVRGKLKPMKR